MSDTAIAQPLDAGSQLTAGSGLDVGSALQAPTQAPATLDQSPSPVDLRLRAVRQVEQTWRLPALPDDVKLDLAGTAGLDHQALSSFLYGIDRDYHNENPEDRPAPAPTPQLILSTADQLPPLAQSGFDKVNTLLQSLRGLPPINELDADATQRWKLQAIKEGFLTAPENGVVDSTWSPELESIQHQMSFSDYNSSLRGNRAGASPVKAVADLVNHWTSPTGLVQAATKLNLWWDTDQISHEFSSWGDKWRKVGKSDGLLDFGKNLIDALTGPIDDVLVPALNIGLLFTGVGAAVDFASFGFEEAAAVGADALAEVNNVNLLYKVPLAGRLFPAGAEAASAAGSALAEPSWLASRLATSSNGFVSGVGDAMKAWRELPGVIGAKAGIQTVARFGALQQAESQFLPNFKGGMLPGQGALVRGTHTAMNSLAATIAEPFLTPYTIFAPGTFVNGGREAVQAAFKFLGTTPGKAVAGALGGAAFGAFTGGDIGTDAAVGAGAAVAVPYLGKALSHLPDKPVSRLVRTAGEAAAHLQWKPLTENMRLTQLFVDAAHQHLPADEVAKFDALANSKGVHAALAERFGVDEASVGGPMGYLALSAAIDHTAAAQAAALGGEAKATAHLLARNKLNAQVRFFDDSTSRNDVIWSIVSTESRSRKDVISRFKEMRTALDESDPDGVQLAELVTHHNEQAQLTMRQLLSPGNVPLPGLDQGALENLKPLFDRGADARLAAMTGYVANTMDTFGNWGKYTSLTSELRSHIQGGLLDEATFVQPISAATNRALSQADHFDEIELPLIDDAKLNNFSAHMDDLMVSKQFDIPGYRRKNGQVNPLARQIDPSMSRLTIARQETASKAAYLEKADELQQVQYTLETWMKATKLKDGAGTPLVLKDLSLGGLSRSEMEQTINALGLKGSKNATTLRRLNRLATAQGITVGDGFETVLRRLADDAATQVELGERFKQPLRKVTNDGKVLTGFDLLKRRVTDLRKSANRTAAEIDAPALVEAIRASKGEEAAQRMQAYVDHLAGQGYKMVYGADFLMPDQLLHDSGAFENMTARHMNAVTLGNFFKRKVPGELQQAVERSQRLAIADHLSRATGKQLAADSPEVNQAMHDLYYVIDGEKDANQRITDELVNANLGKKLSTSLHEATRPRSIQDLSLGRNRNNLVGKLIGSGWSNEEASAIWTGLKAGRVSDFKNLGLAALEAKLRSHNQLLDILHTLGGTENASVLRQVGRGALVGAAAGAVAGGPDLTSIAEGAAAGAIGGPLANKAAKVLDHSEWAKYGYLADNLVSLRDAMRFSLNPYFSVSRSVESHMLANIAAPKYITAGEHAGERLALPFNQSPGALLKRLEKEATVEQTAAGFADKGVLGARMAAKQKFEDIHSEMRAASRGNFDPNAIESTAQWFRQRGLTGYDPTAWMASSFHHLRQAGMGPEEAMQSVRKMYTLGTTGRSAAEQSVNFLFFPFSFQKKIAGHMANWISDDVVRSVLIHDAFKTYDLLDKRYDLGTWLQEHVPVLQDLQRLNLFAYGVSAGRLGGINAPIVNPILNLFLPQGVDTSNKDASDQLLAVVKKSIPAINDIQMLVDDARSQGYALASPDHATRAAEVNHAYTEWNNFKDGVGKALKARGETWGQIYQSNDPALVQAKQMYDQQKLELMQKYPAWKDALLKSQGNMAQLEQERKVRLDTVRFAPEKATPVDIAFATFEQQLEQLKEYVATQGVTDWSDLSSDEYRAVQRTGFEIAQRVPGWINVWKKFYSPVFGPITSETP